MIVSRVKSIFINHKDIIIPVAIFLAFILGMHLITAPIMEKQQALQLQRKLLDSIKYGEGVVHVDGQTAVKDVDFYIPDDSQPASSLFTDTDGEIIVKGIGILIIDAIDLELPATDGVTPAQLKVALGHIPQTAALGEKGNAVIAGHRSYIYGQFFNRLGEISVGDSIRYVSAIGEVMEFAVSEITEVQPEDQTAFAQPEEKSQLTLYTCTPVKTATHRLLIRADRIA